MLFYVVGTIELRERLGIRAENRAQSMLLAIFTSSMFMSRSREALQCVIFRFSFLYRVHSCRNCQ